MNIDDLTMLFVYEEFNFSSATTVIIHDVEYFNYYQNYFSYFHNIIIFIIFDRKVKNI